MGVSTPHKDYTSALQRWQLVDDVCNGQSAIKQAGVAYLPMINADDNSKANLDRYDAYKKRAVFFEVTKDTLQKNMGIVFAEDPNFDPDTMEFLKYNADGAGKSLYQINQSALSGLLRHGRGGFFVDYPSTQGETSRADIESKGIRPVVMFVSALDIINWRVRLVGAEWRLSLVVLQEKITEPDESDEFQEKEVTQYRVLKLDENNKYCVQVYRDEVPHGDLFYPRNARGQLWDLIPFYPIGAQANDFKIDEIPLESLALMNLSHYRNSAEYESSVFYSGQVQPVMTGLDTEWRDYLNEKGFRMGNGEALMLPVGSTFDFKQAQGSSLAKEAMDAKAEYMESLGAKMLERSQSIKTATQVDSESLSQHSVLSLCVANLNEAAEVYLKWLAAYNGSGDKAVFSIKQDFAKGQITLDELKFYNELVLQQTMSEQTFHEIRTTGKVAEIDFKEEARRLESERDGTTLQ